MRVLVMTRQVGFVLMASLGLLLLSGCGSEEQGDPIAVAREALEKREYRAAEIALKNALKRDPENAEARLLLAEGHLRFGDGRAADTQLKKAAAGGMPESRLLFPRQQAAMLQRKYEAVLALDISTLKPAEYPLSLRADLAAIQGDAELGLGNYEAAAARYEAAMALVPNNASARVGQAQIAVRTKDLGKALSLARQATVDAPGYAPAWSLVGDLTSQAGDLDAAEAAYTKAIDLRDTNRQDLLGRALVHVSKRNLEAARSDAKYLKRQGFDLPHGAFARGVILLQEGRLDQARGEFERVLANSPDFIIAACYLGRANAANNQYEQAAAQLGRCFKYYGGINFIRRLYASVLLLNHRVNEAEEVLGPLVERGTPESLDTELLAQIKLAGGDPRSAIDLMRRILEADESSAAAHRSLGIALLAAGESKASGDAFKAAENLEAAEAGSEAQENGRLLEAKAFIDGGQPALAIPRLQELIAKNPTARRPVNFLALAFLRNGERDKAKAVLSEFLQRDPDYVLGATNLARLHAGDQEFDQAISVLQRMNDREPGNPSIVGLLVACETAAGAPSRAESHLEKALKLSPAEPGLLIVKARFEKSQGRREDALATYSKLAERKQVDPAWLRELRELQVASGYLPQAIETARRLADMPAPDARDQLALEQLQIRIGDNLGSAQTLKKALAANPDVLAIRVANLQALLRANDLSAAREEMNTLRKRLEDKMPPELALLEAGLLGKEGNIAAARALAQKTLAGSPSGQVVIEIARLQGSLGQPEAAIETLETWTAKHPDDATVAFVLADAYAKRGRTKEAIARYESLLERAPKQPWALNNLAWLLRNSAPKRALVLASEALALAPDSAAILDTNGTLLAGQGQLEPALKHFREAIKLAPESPEIRLHLARALVGTRAYEEARSTLNGIAGDGLPAAERKEYDALEAELRDAL